MHAMTLATTCSHAWSAQCVIIVAPMSARHGYITADWSHPFADPDAAASPALTGAKTAAAWTSLFPARNSAF